MTVRASLLLGGAILGASLAIAVTGHADPGQPSTPPTVYVPVTVTVQVDRTIERHGVQWWRAHAVANRRHLNHANLRLERARLRIRRETLASRRRWTPTLRYGEALALAAFGVDQRSRTYCESTDRPWITNPSGHMGALQFSRSTWNSTPFAGFSPFDPVAAELAGGWMVARAGRSGEWSCPLG